MSSLSVLQSLWWWLVFTTNYTWIISPQYQLLHIIWIIAAQTRQFVVKLDYSVFIFAFPRRNNCCLEFFPGLPYFLTLLFKNFHWIHVIGVGSSLNLGGQKVNRKPYMTAIVIRDIPYFRFAENLMGNFPPTSYAPAC